MHSNRQPRDLNLAPSPLLEIVNLSVTYPAPSLPAHAVRGVSLNIYESETVALVGETGSGKSSLALAVLGLLGEPARIEADALVLEKQDLRQMPPRDWSGVRGRKIGMVFQDARGALNPVLTIRDHMVETLRAHQKMSTRNAGAQASELLREVGIPQEQESRYPFELSGGACQRVGIALALCNHPRLLIADEPTSAIDAATQAHILALLQRMQRRYGLALLLISHDLSMIAQMADRVAILYHGRLVESGTRKEVFDAPRHPYTRGLLRLQPHFAHHHQSNPLVPIPGQTPGPGEAHAGCAFAARCAVAEAGCRLWLPPETAVSATHRVRCFLADKAGASGSPDPSAKGVA